MNTSQKLQALILILVLMNSKNRSVDRLEIVHCQIDWPTLLQDISIITIIKFFTVGVYT